MKHLVLTLVTASLFVTPSSGNGNPPEFLEPINGADEAAARASNDYFLRKNTYFAKDYRIVEVNAALLKSAEKIKISLIGDSYVIAEVTALKVKHGESSIRWYGRIVEPTLSVDELRTDSHTLEEAKIAHRAIVGLTITATEISFDRTTGIKYQYYFPRFERFRNPENSGLYDVSMTIKGLLSFQYELVPLESDPRYHVLMQVDPDKVFSAGLDKEPEDPEEVMKWQAYRDFVESLGPDPRPQDLHKE